MVFHTCCLNEVDTIFTMRVQRSQGEILGLKQIAVYNVAIAKLDTPSVHLFYQAMLPYTYDHFTSMAGKGHVCTNLANGFG